MFKLQGVSFAYAGRPALVDVDLEIKAGEWLAILGPNGSGKSTLLKLLYQALRPGRGSIQFSGRPLASYSQTDLSRCIGVVPQDTEIRFPFLVEEIVLIGRTPHAGSRWFDSPEDIAFAKRIMSETGIDTLAGRPVTALSAGERQRVIIARALAQSPRVLLLDEPTAFLDIRHRIEICGLLGGLNEHNELTLVTALHDINLAARHCSRVVFLREGRVVCAGSPNALINEETLEEVYGVRVRVEQIDGAPVVLPHPVVSRQPRAGRQPTLPGSSEEE